MDLNAFYEWLAVAAPRSAEDPRYRAAARMLVDATSGPVLPKHVHAIVAQRERQGATIEELTALHKAGNDLVRFFREPPANAPAQDEPAPDTAQAAKPDATEVPKPDPLTSADPYLLAKLPVAAFRSTEELGDFSSVLARYGWIGHALTAAFGLGLLSWRLSIWKPILSTGAQDMASRMAGRTLGWIGSACLLLGAAGIAERFGWFDRESLVSRTGGFTPLGRLLSPPALFFARTAAVVAGILILPFALTASKEKAEKASGMREGHGAMLAPGWSGHLKLQAAVDSTWRHDRSRDEVVQSGNLSWRISRFAGVSDPSSRLALMTSGPPVSPEFLSSRGAIAPEAQSVGGWASAAFAMNDCTVDCDVGPPKSSVNVLCSCTESAADEARTHAVACSATSVMVTCAAIAAPGPADATREAARRLVASARPLLF